MLLLSEYSLLCYMQDFLVLALSSFLAFLFVMQLRACINRRRTSGSHPYIFTTLIWYLFRICVVGVDAIFKGIASMPIFINTGWISNQEVVKDCELGE